MLYGFGHGHDSLNLIARDLRPLNGFGPRKVRALFPFPPKKISCFLF
jgi:hypothetical protein